MLQQAHLWQISSKLQAQLIPLFHAIAFLFLVVDMLQMPQVQYQLIQQI